jgi:hypothetical protein
MMRAPRHVLGSKVEILPPALDRFTRLPGLKHSALGDEGRTAAPERNLGGRVAGCEHVHEHVRNLLSRDAPDQNPAAEQLLTEIRGETQSAIPVPTTESASPRSASSVPPENRSAS